MAYGRRFLVFCLCWHVNLMIHFCTPKKAATVLFLTVEAFVNSASHHWPGPVITTNNLISPRTVQRPCQLFSALKITDLNQFYAMCVFILAILKNTRLPIWCKLIYNATYWSAILKTKRTDLFAPGSKRGHPLLFQLWAPGFFKPTILTQGAIMGVPVKKTIGGHPYFLKPKGHPGFLKPFNSNKCCIFIWTKIQWLLSVSLFRTRKEQGTLPYLN